MKSERLATGNTCHKHIISLALTGLIIFFIDKRPSKPQVIIEESQRSSKEINSAL